MGIFEKLIKDMEVGELGYTLPWALVRDTEGNDYVHLLYPVVPDPIKDTGVMPIRRFGPGREDYHVFPNFNYNGIDPEYRIKDKEDMEFILYHQASGKHFVKLPREDIFLNIDMTKNYSLEEQLKTALEVEDYERVAQIKKLMDEQK